MENTLENETVLENETLETVQEPIVIEKKPRKKHETQSLAQLEILRRGRERLAEKPKETTQRAYKSDRKKQKKVTELIEKCSKTLKQIKEKSSLEPPQ